MLSATNLFRRCGTVMALLLSLGLLTDGRAQTSTPQPRSPQVQPSAPLPDRPAPGVLIAPQEDYRLAPGDTIEIQVEDAAELGRTIRITAAGDFEMPFLGVIAAQGKTTAELAKSIAASLREQDYLKQPQVTVTVKQYNSQNFFIHGAVRQPGVYQVEGHPSLIRLISLAGGLADNHGATALILRPVKATERQSDIKAEETRPQTTTGKLPSEESEPYDLIRVNINAIYQGNFERNLKIEPGDIINIPLANVFFVAGEVHAPGSFPLKDGTTLRQAISLAQGTTFKAAQGRGIIFRDQPESGKRQEIRVDIGDVMSGKKEDLLIFPNDVIIVPNSRTKSVSSALLTALGINSARIPIRY